ncbi:GATA transcription factor 26-like [Iris pallida]|uniref:GATA transcription factor 26-like n=1 Tax=Iris pallida TaxID=29817 RepID=A0AAX6EKL1_IRIPA|nr:GATA transcription factor 26-like [Iris pallida]
MGKHGPCCHCGVTNTPLWRNGPPDKPVLCNACGSRWRTKGSLTNYTPLHARDFIDSEEFKVSKVKSITFKPKEKKIIKIKQAGPVEIERELPYSDQNFRKVLLVDTSNRSSSGSAISYSESCAQFGTIEASDLTGSAQSKAWESLVPSKKRTCVICPKPSSVEKLTKDLCSILHEQQSSYRSSTEEDLLYDSLIPTGSFEIGNGSVLLRYPNPKTVEEESEASSLPRDNRSYITYETYSGSASFPLHSESNGAGLSVAGIGKLKKSAAYEAQEHAKRGTSSSDKLHILRDIDSPLGFTNLKEFVNLEVLMRHMTYEEQQRLMKLLPSIDTAKPPESLRSMFNSSQFVETLSYFQQLLQEGIFDLSNSAVNDEEYKILRRHVLQNLTRSTWVEHYKKLKDVKCKQNPGGKGVATRPNFLGHSSLTTLKRPRDIENQHAPEPGGNMRSPKRVSKSGGSGTNLPSIATQKPNSNGGAGSKSVYDAEEFVDNDGACFSPRSFFASPPDRSSMLCSLQFTDGNSDHDLLIDVPCNTSSFPEAELLYPPWSRKPGVPNNTPSQSRVDGEDSVSKLSASSFCSEQPRRQ